jgi:rhodanese-related sulfurtransferase
MSCAAGIRAASAVEILQRFGYSNVARYKGSFADWHANTQDKC